MTTRTLRHLAVLWIPLLALALTSPSAAAPSVQVKPGKIDLGVIEEGQFFERFLEVSNGGDGVLVLEDVKTSCGCTAAAVEGIAELRAGESQKVRVTFDSKNMDGTVKKRVTITTNDPALPQVAVDLVAEVHKAIRWTPKYVSLNKIGANTEFEQLVQLQSDTHLELKVLETRILGGTLRNSPTQLFDLESTPPRVEGDRNVHEFVVRLREGVKPQKISETLEIVTNQPAPDDTLKLAIRGEIAGRIRVVPNFAVMRMVDPGQETARDLTLTASEGTFNVIRADVQDGPIVTEIHPDENGRQTVIRLIYKGGEPGSNGTVPLVIETDDPDQRLFELSVRYQTRGTGEGVHPAAESKSASKTTKASSTGPQ